MDGTITTNPSVPTSAQTSPMIGNIPLPSYEEDLMKIESIKPKLDSGKYMYIYIEFFF